MTSSVADTGMRFGGSIMGVPVFARVVGGGDVGLGTVGGCIGNSFKVL
jgi:hypothetical protein